MMKTYRVETGATIAEVADLVSATLTLELSLRESSYYGGNYYLGRDDGRELRVIQNYLEDDAPFFKDQRLGAVFVQFSDIPRADDLLAKHAGFAAVDRA